MKKRKRPQRIRAARQHPSGSETPAQPSLLERLKVFSDTLGRCLNVQRGLEELLDNCLQATHATRGAGYLLENEHRLTLGTQRGFPRPLLESLNEFWGESGWLRSVIENEAPLAAAAGGAGEAPVATILSRAKAQSLLVVPLTLGKDRLGALVLFSPQEDLMESSALFTRPVLMELGQATALARAIHLATASEQRFRDLVHGLDAIVWEADPETWRFTFVSRRAEEILGYPVQQWLQEAEFWVNHIHEEDRSRAVAYCRKATSEGRHHELEYRAVAADGRIVWLRDVIRVVKDEAGQVTLLRGLMTDITARKQAERALQERSTYLYALIEISPLAVVVLDGQHRVQMVNPAFERLFQYRQEEVVGTNLDEFIAPPEGAVEAAGFTKQILSGESLHATTRRRRKDGSLVDVEIYGVPLMVEGQLVGVYGIYQDVTERERALEALRQSEERLSKVFRSTPDAISITTLEEGRYVEVNEGFSQLTGYRREEVIGRTAAELRVWADAGERDRVVERLRQEGTVRDLEIPTRLKSGDLRVCLLSAEIIELGGETCLLAVARDITERQQAEQALRASEAKFRALTETASSAIFITQENRIRYINRAAEKITGYSLEELLTIDFWELVHPDFREQVRQRREARLRGEKPPSRYEFKIVWKDGAERWIDFSAALIEYEGRPSVLGTAFDITERKQAEEALRQSEANYRSLVDNAPYGIFRSSQNGALLAVNPALVEMLSYESTEQVRRLNLARDICAEPLAWDAFIEQYGRRERFGGAEVEWRRKSGEVITVRLGGRTVRGTRGQVDYFEVMAEDITERKLLEQQLRQAQKMEAVGRLAGGVAHDFNNLLMVIRGHTELLQSRLGSNDPNFHHIEEVEKASERAAALIQQLLAFSRKQMAKPRVLDLNHLVAEMEPLLRRLIGEHIELRAILGDALGRVKADPNQIEQVIMNLAVNARDAMPKGGRLLLETANTELDETFAAHHPGARSGRYVMLVVTDTGVGMDAETLAHIFEPFFTTKDKGRGTGLGMATVYGIVKQNDGYIWVYSEPNRGTTCKVYVPRVEEEAERIVDHRREPAAVPLGSETVLLVEDEEQVRRLARQLLESSGYRVLEAGTPKEALSLAKQFQEPIHLLMTDVVMPGMNGRELAEHLLKMRPELKVLYMSGYTDDAMVYHGVLEPGTRFLQKPFTLAMLAQSLREVLGSAKS